VPFGLPAGSRPCCLLLFTWLLLLLNSCTSNVYICCCRPTLPAVLPLLHSGARLPLQHLNTLLLLLL
jgi:hypothetical protein